MIVEFTADTDTCWAFATVAIPPPTLLLTVELIMVRPGLAGPMEMPPPTPLLTFESTVELVIVIKPCEAMPPPAALARLPEIVVRCTVSGPAAKIPPPLPDAWPPVMVRFCAVNRPEPSWRNTLSAQVCRTVCPCPSTVTGSVTAAVRSMAPPPVQSVSTMSACTSICVSVANAALSSASFETVTAAAGLARPTSMLPATIPATRSENPARCSMRGR